MVGFDLAGGIAAAQVCVQGMLRVDKFATAIGTVFANKKIVKLA